MRRTPTPRPGTRRPAAGRGVAGAILAAATLLSACQPGLTGPGDAPGQQGATALGQLALWVEPDSRAQRQAEAWQATRPADAQYMTRIAREAQGIWFGDWNADIRRDVSGTVAASAAAGAVPVLVAYNIPERDCGSYSAGGAADGPAYLGWIREFARGLAGGRPIVVLEPDATASMECLTAAGRALRLELLGEAVRLLKTAGAYVYLDAGNPFWRTAEEMAPILRAAGVDQADGFALNVSNYHSTDANIRYGQSLSRLLGGARFVIDTSRNGLGTTDPGDWCNARDQALGERPRTTPGPERVDAYLWIKRPGESDGICNGGPAAGAWWADYALGLAQRQPVALAAGS
jgi:endoglucanase